MYLLMIIIYKYSIQHCNIYEIVGAAMSSFKPREKELKTYTLKEYEPEFHRKLVGKHIQRLRTIYSKCCLEKLLKEFACILKWENKQNGAKTIFISKYWPAGPAPYFCPMQFLGPAEKGT